MKSLGVATGGADFPAKFLSALKNDRLPRIPFLRSASFSILRFFFFTLISRTFACPRWHRPRASCARHGYGDVPLQETGVFGNKHVTANRHSCLRRN